MRTTKWLGNSVTRFNSILLPNIHIAPTALAIYNNLDHSVSFWVKAPVDTENAQNDRRVFSEGSTADNDPLFTLGTAGSGTSQSLAVFIRGDAGGRAR